ncbi:hypothetical protein [Helicobacter sp. T3_23-1059]
MIPPPLRRGLGGGFLARICIFVIASFCDFAKSYKNLTHGNPRSRRHCKQFDFTSVIASIA